MGVRNGLLKVSVFYPHCLMIVTLLAFPPTVACRGSGRA